MIISRADICFLSFNEVIYWGKLHSTGVFRVLFLNSIQRGIVWCWRNSLELHLGMNLLVLNFNSGFHMVIWKTEGALLKVLFLSKCRHCLPVVFMWSGNMRIFSPIEHSSLRIPKAPALLLLIKILERLVFYVIKTDSGSSWLDSAEPLLLSKADWWNTVSQSVRGLIVRADKALGGSEVLKMLGIHAYGWLLSVQRGMWPAFVVLRARKIARIVCLNGALLQCVFYQWLLYGLKPILFILPENKMIRVLLSLLKSIHPSCGLRKCGCLEWWLSRVYGIK